MTKRVSSGVQWQFVCQNSLHEFSVLSGHADCPKCGDLLDPDLMLDDAANARERKRRASELVDVADARAASTSAVDRSGVWAFREWVLPSLKERDIVTLGEGRSPLVDVELAGRTVLVKQCGQQPTGSFKDLGMTVLVSAANAMRKKRGIEALVCASTGDTSAALAAYGARAKIPVVVLLPKGKVSPAQLLQPLAHGARVVELDGDFDACMRVVADIGKRPGFLLANSKNPLRLLGQMTVALETVRDLGWKMPGVVVVPSGNLGNVYAMYLGFDLLRRLGVARGPLPRLVAAQASAADPLHRARERGWDRLTPVTAGETLATAIRIGNPVSFNRAVYAIGESKGTTTTATESQIVDAMRVLDRQGLLACPQTGAAIDGARQLIESRAIKKSERVVVVSTASGLKFSEAKAAVETNRPISVVARVEAVVEALSSSSQRGSAA